jgi:hypothetical protein
VLRAHTRTRQIYQIGVYMSGYPKDKEKIIERRK